MKIHEYQAKAILARHGVPVPRGGVTFDASDAAAAPDVGLTADRELGTDA